MRNLNDPLDPLKPFIAEDGLEYEDLAAYICGQPIDCWRNRTIQSFREGGRSEEAIREWIKGYDGDDPAPSAGWHLTISREDRLFRARRADALAFKVERHDDFAPF